MMVAVKTSGWWWLWGGLVWTLGCQQEGPDFAFTATTKALHGFPIGPGPHDVIDCNDCHGPFDTFRDFSCVGCHPHSVDVMGPSHAGVSQYVHTPVIGCSSDSGGARPGPRFWMTIRVYFG